MFYIVMVALFCLIWGNIAWATTTDKYIGEYHSDGYVSSEWYQEHTDGSIFPDVYYFKTPDNYQEVGVGYGQTFPWRNDFAYGCVLGGYLAGGNSQELWVEPSLIIWGKEANWGFDIPVFQYIPLNSEAYTYTLVDEARIYFKPTNKIQVGISSVAYLDSSSFTEDHGPFVTLDTDIGEVRISYRNDQFEINISKSF
jgi:hypothetical protein